MHGVRCQDIQPVRRLLGNDQPWRGAQLPRQHELLLVPARQGANHLRWARAPHVVLADGGIHHFRDPPEAEESSPGERRLVA